MGGRSGLEEVVQGGFEGGGGLGVDEGEGDGEGEAAGAGAARVEVEDAALPRDRRLVRVAADDGADAGGGGVEVEVVHGVHEVEEVAGELDGLGWREIGAGARGVDVATDGGDGRDLLKGAEDGDLADVAGVEDMVDAGEGGERLGTEEAVGVGEDADAHQARRSVASAAVWVLAEGWWARSGSRTAMV